MANDERAQGRAEAQKDKPVFVVRMVGIVDEQTLIIRESGLRFFERNPMLTLVCTALRLVPFETKFDHDYNVHTLYIAGKGATAERRPR